MGFCVYSQIKLISTLFTDIVIYIMLFMSVVILAASVIMILFCFGCAYLGAGRIKKISVTELMTE